MRSRARSIVRIGIIHADMPIVLFDKRAYDRLPLQPWRRSIRCCRSSRRTAEAIDARDAPRASAPRTKALFLEGSPDVPVYEEELWTSRQRQACSIHEVSYRACFKPQLPAYFIERLSDEGDLVYDPFSGRGTTAVEAALRGRRVVANDINPLSSVFARPRLEVPHVSEVDARLNAIDLDAEGARRRSICRCSSTRTPSASS